MAEPNKIGIIIDNFKVKRCLIKLNEAGFTDVSCDEYKANISLIKVVAPIEDNPKIQRVLKENELHFSRRN